jgi:EAL domain-containing protein (putative c-di-GMP-specific phosphodiesterase class I)
LLPTVADESEVTAIAESISEALRAPVVLGNFEAVHTASVGIAVSSEVDRSPSDLLRRADLAMYQAKEQGKCTWVKFDSDMSARADRRLEIENSLRTALENGEFTLMYQPLVSLPNNQVTGVEALLRWKHPTRGVVLPSEFISVAEDIGLIVPIGRWVLEQATTQAREWARRYPAFSCMSVNVSGRQFQHPGFAEQVDEIITQLGLPPHLLQLEITESVLMDERSNSLEVLRRLKTIGVAVAIDDFGTGYSSLSYLRQYPIDVLKVDKSFVDAIETEEEARALVQTIIGLAHTLQLRATAEGVERWEQVEQLSRLSCDSGQGYVFARPLDSESIGALLAGGPLVGQEAA